MDKSQIQKALTELQQQPKRKFVQSYDLILNLKDVMVKQNPVDFYASLPHSGMSKVKVAAFVDVELAAQAQKCCDVVIREQDFMQYKDKKAVKKLAEEYDYFIAQANLMPKVAAAFGRVLGARGKMPNPKLGCVVPNNANLELLVKKLQSMVRLQAKKGMNLQCRIGKENQPEEQLIENVLSVYAAALKNLPNEAQNVRNTMLKLTMGKPVKM